MVVALVENLRGDVVRRAEFLVKVAVGIVDEGSTEVNDLNLIELLVLLEEDVLGLQVTMDDVGLMAVVDARKHLLHENSGIALTELSALKDLVEELAALADLSHKIVSLFVLEEFVHLDDVGMVLYKTLKVG